MPEKSATFLRKPFMAMPIFALGSFSVVRQNNPSCILPFGCLKLVETKNYYWHCAGLKVHITTVSQEVASEASNKSCCYQAEKRMNFKVTVTECEGSKNS